MSRRNRHLLTFAAAAALALVALEAAARPGGGQGYSGGGGGGHSSGDGDGAGLIIYFLIRLVVTYPTIGVPLLLVILVLGYWRSHVAGAQQKDTFLGGAPGAGVRRQPASLARLRDRDPMFSAVLFEDFIYALYARVHAARSDPLQLATLAPYVNESARAALQGRDPTGVPIEGVVIGTMRVCSVQLGAEPGTKTLVELEFEANYTARLAAGPTGYYVRERWTLERDSQLQSKPPVQVQEFRCPNCGAPFTGTGDDRCSFCHQEVGEGRFDWAVKQVRMLEQETRPPALTADHAEQGTDAPTIYQPRIQAEHAAMIAEDPSAAPERIEQRLRAIYRELNAAWSARDLRPARPFVSDSLFNYLGYWIAAYKQQGLRNVLEQMEISRMVIVKLVRDRHFDAITVRLWASGLDYTVREQDGKRVSGSARSKRAYSEYWTLIRGARVRGAPQAGDARCPGCGAPLDRVSMAGNCEYCGAHLTRGEFDWVLSKIEQDDAYAG
jgi:hypothetical protein